MQYHRSKTRCKSCGTRRSEWDPETGGDRNAYSAVLTHCRGCQVVGTKQAELSKQKLPTGTYVTLQSK